LLYAVLVGVGAAGEIVGKLGKRFRAPALVPDAAYHGVVEGRLDGDLLPLEALHVRRVKGVYFDYGEQGVPRHRRIAGKGRLVFRRAGYGSLFVPPSLHHLLEFEIEGLCGNGKIFPVPAAGDDNDGLGAVAPLLLYALVVVFLYGGLDSDGIVPGNVVHVITAHALEDPAPSEVERAGEVAVDLYLRLPGVGGFEEEAARGGVGAEAAAGEGGGVEGGDGGGDGKRRRGGGGEAD
jgi:hypothetical protein